MRASYRMTLFLAALGAGGGWLAWRAARVPPRQYRAAGYGGYAPAAPKASGPRSASAAAAPDPVREALASYNAGNYRDAEAAAQAVLERARGARDPAVRQQGARAEWVVAFAAARRKEYSLARERFAALREAAAGQVWTLEEAAVRGGARTADEGARPAGADGHPLPTLEEEGAYQHAVLTAALGDRAGAEAEYREFLRRYPECPLLNAAVRRLARLHSGDLPPDAEALRQQALRIARERERARERRAARCGPECLAEVLRRCAGIRVSRYLRIQGEPGERVSGGTEPARLPTTEELARELGTDGRGTSLAALAHAARRHGLAAEGFRLTDDGLRDLLAGRLVPSRRRQPQAATSSSPLAAETGRARGGGHPEGPAERRGFSPSHESPGGGGRVSAAQVVALIQPGHFVLMEGATPEWITLWDPDAAGPGKPGRRVVSAVEWRRLWQGVALAIR